jgi:homocitrate synthase NifV
LESDLLFIDQTLSYALKRKVMDASEVDYIQRTISAMAQVILDIPLDLLIKNKGCTAINPQNVRVGILSDVNQVKQAYDLGVSHIKVPFESAILEDSALPFMEVLEEASKRGLKTVICGVNIAQYSWETTAMIRKLLHEYTITGIIIDDRAACLDPLATYGVLSDLKPTIPCPLEYHGHNTKGLATGNALGAIKSGTYNIAVSIGGVGGYPAFEEVIMSMGLLLHLPVLVPQNLAIRCKEIFNCMGQSIPATKPIIGSRIFAHESGIHVDGIIKKSELYEPFAPETVGLSRMIIIGKHSGKAAIKEKLRELNIDINPSAIPEILERVHGLSIKLKGPVSDAQFQKLVREALS